MNRTVFDEPTVAATEGSISVPSTSADTVKLRRGDSIGRFVVIGELGRGAMGTVYAAFDAKLERQVALKLLHRTDRGIGSLLAEAQALARIDHPHVVTVHDVGEHDGRLFLAMELVRGRSLRAWQSLPDRTWREVVEVYRKAARGLAAVHAADIVHGDFKPDNVMVAEDGRVLVMDFGIARPLASTVSDDFHASGSGSRSIEVSRIRGTPAYMAPEQFRLEGVGPASDQFGFCVALHEALWGERPFEGSTLAELVDAVANGCRRSRPNKRQLPGWLVKIVDRGLSLDAADRFESMSALDDAFDASLRRRMMAFTILGAVGLTGAVGMAIVLTPSEASPCEEAAHALRDDVVGVALDPMRERVVAIDHPDAQMVWQNIDRNLDEFVQTWIATNASQCAPGPRVRPEIAQARRACLDRQRDAVETTLDLVVSDPDLDLTKASAFSSTLPSPKKCAAIDDADGTFDPQTEALRTAHATFARARALYELGKPEDADRVGSDALDRALSLDAHRLATEVLVWRSAKRRYQGKLDAALVDIKEAQRQAARSGSRRLSFLAWLTRIDLQILREPSARDATELMLEAAELALLEAEAPGDLRAKFLVVRGSWLDDLGETEEALQLLNEAFELAQHTEVSTLEIASLHNLRGAVFAHMGSLDRARADFERARDIRESLLGPHAPGLSTPRGNIAGLCVVLNDFPCARRAFEQMQSSLEASNDHSSPSAADLEARLAELSFWEGRPQESESHARRSLAIAREGGFDDLPFTIAARSNLLRALGARQAWEEGRIVANELLRVAKRRFSEGGDLSTAYVSVAGFHEDAGEFDRAIEMVRKARAMRERHLNPQDPRIAMTWEEESSLLLSSERLDDARAALDRADALLAEAEGVTLLQQASVRWTRLRIRDASGEREAAVADALALLAELDGDAPDLVAVRERVAQWLQDRGVDPTSAPLRPPAG